MSSVESEPKPRPASAKASSPSKESSKTAARVTSIDAFRGFIMFWIIGGDALAEALHKTSPTNFFTQTLATQLDHVPWAGIHFYDLIFPSFVFIIGVSLVFSLTRRIGESGKMGVTLQILRRAVILYLLGLFVYDGISQGYQHIRLLGVLQRLALCYLFAGIAFTWLKPRGLVILCATLLILYWGLMTFVPVPGVGAGNFAEGKNLANYIDREYLPLRKWDGDHDPEGLLSTLPAIASCLVGVFAGLLIKNNSVPDRKKVGILLLAGVASIVIGFAWGLQFPVIKKIWTSSYVLVAGGFSALFLGFFYLIIDVWDFQLWSRPFIWIGSNAIAIYVAEHLVKPTEVARRFVGGEIKTFFDTSVASGFGDVVIVLVSLALCLWFVRFLYVRKIFIKV